MGTEKRIETTTEYSYPFSYGLICPFLSRREGFSNDCLRRYCMMWQDNECLFVAMYRRENKNKKEVKDESLL